MLEPWNDASLLPPPVHTFSCNRLAGIHELRFTFKNIIKVLSKQSPLHKESAILSRFAYKFDKKFRNDIGYRNYKKVNVALRRYLLLNLLKDVESFSDTLPHVDDEVYLPTRQMLEYVLLRLLTFSKIMLRICICSKKASVFYLDRIKSGDSHWMSLMPYAVLSRVWSMCSVLLRHACNWYSQLFPWLDKLQIKGVVFLPKGYNFPTDLENWLDLDNIDNFGRFEWAPDKCLSLQQNLIEAKDEDGDNLDSILDFVNQINDNNESEDLPATLFFKAESHTPLQPATQLEKNTDQGEIISREHFKATAFPAKTKPELKVTLKSNNHSPANVTNTNSLKDFIVKEESHRNENSDSSLTSHLSFMQWQALKNSLNALLENLSNRKIQKKFKKIWKEKCVDYS